MRGKMVALQRLARAGMLALVTGILASDPVLAEETTSARGKVIFILDGSASMWGRIDEQPKIVIAKELMTDLVGDLPDTMDMGLQVYGHRRKGDCSDIEMVVPMGSDRAAMIESIQSIMPKGKTPITQSLTLTGDALRTVEEETTVVLISDGKETCDADPCALVRELRDQGIRIRVHVVGFDVKDDEREQLMCIADAGEGKYFSAMNTEELEIALKEVRQEVAEPAPEPAPTPPSGPQAFATFRDQLSDGSPGPIMVALPAGKFWMGSPDNEPDRKRNERRHEVEVADFAMGQMEVTVAEFRRFVEATGYETEAERDVSWKGCIVYDSSMPSRGDAGDQWRWWAGRNWRNPGYSQADDHPVVCVSWNDALAYTEWLSAETDQSYRLPTEAEWEYAARAGETAAHPWRRREDQACKFANVLDLDIGQERNFSTHLRCADGHHYSSPVASFAANEWGLFDMIGNVYEWTCSKYDEDYGTQAGRCAAGGSAVTRVAKGGAWSSGSSRARFAWRFIYLPIKRDDVIGFRVARSL